MFCHIIMACRNEKVLSVSDMMANTAVRESASPSCSSSISSSLRSSRTPSVAIGARRTLQEMMMDLRVLPAALLNWLYWSSPKSSLSESPPTLAGIRPSELRRNFDGSQLHWPCALAAPARLRESPPAFGVPTGCPAPAFSM